MDPTRTKLMEFLDANGYSYQGRAEVLDDTQQDDDWQKLKTTGRSHLGISFDGESCVDTFTELPDVGAWRR